MLAASVEATSLFEVGTLIERPSFVQSGDPRSNTRGPRAME